VSGHVFVSYSQVDRAYVDALAAHLQSAGLRVWYDHSIATGEGWAETIHEQIDTCAAFIVVMTPAAESSTWVAREINHAEETGKPILPILRIRWLSAPMPQPWPAAAATTR
jgi:hypothetical protein